MAKRRDETASEPTSLRRDWPHLLSFGSLFIAVVAILVLAAVLRSGSTTGGDDEREPDRAAPSGMLPPADLPATDAPATSQPEPVNEIDRLGRRALDDVGRLAAHEPGWTAQLILMCDPALARKRVDEFQGIADLYLLPAMYEGDACFRLCWGHYTTREAAKQARDLPSALRALQPAPFPRPIAEVLE